MTARRTTTGPPGNGLKRGRGGSYARRTASARSHDAISLDLRPHGRARWRKVRLLSQGPAWHGHESRSGRTSTARGALNSAISRRMMGFVVDCQLLAGGLRDGAALSLSQAVAGSIMAAAATAQIWLDVLEQNQDLHTPSGASHAPGVSSRRRLHSWVGVHVNRHRRRWSTTEPTRCEWEPVCVCKLRAPVAAASSTSARLAGELSANGLSEDESIGGARRDDRWRPGGAPAG
ncbi:hypothetical protein PSPO01_02957 [Paraphaeosphaeria sporulosa]